MKTILFYNENEAYGYFSNYYMLPITINGVEYASVEHYYQSRKTQSIPYSEKIRSLTSRLNPKTRNITWEKLPVSSRIQPSI